GNDQRSSRDEQRRAAGRSASPTRAAHDLRRAERAGQRTDDPAGEVTPAARLPAVDAEADRGAYGAGHEDGDDPPDALGAGEAGEEDADRSAQACADTDPVPRTHPSSVEP